MSTKILTLHKNNPGKVVVASKPSQRHDLRHPVILNDPIHPKKTHTQRHISNLNAPGTIKPKKKKFNPKAITKTGGGSRSPRPDRGYERQIKAGELPL